jgi:hypothetical protein
MTQDILELAEEFNVNAVINANGEWVIKCWYKADFLAFSAAIQQKWQARVRHLQETIDANTNTQQFGADMVSKYSEVCKRNAQLEEAIITVYKAHKIAERVHPPETVMQAEKQLDLVRIAGELCREALANKSDWTAKHDAEVVAKYQAKLYADSLASPETKRKDRSYE